MPTVLRIVIDTVTSGSFYVGRGFTLRVRALFQR
jgi:hypothetical protein